MTTDLKALSDAATDGTMAEHVFAATLINLYRAGQLVQVPSVDELAVILYNEGVSSCHADRIAQAILDHMRKP